MLYAGRLFLLFMICSVGGWVFDTFLRSVRRRRWAPIRLIPFSPLYGLGAFVVLYSPVFAFAPSPASRVLIEYLYFSVLFCVFEYVAGAVILRVTGSRIWDYRDRHFNIHGHTDLFHFVLWGLAGVVGLYFIRPPVTALLGLSVGSG